MEVKCEAKLYMIVKKCDRCGEGKMVRNGNVVFTVDPPIFPHKCDKCGHEEAYNVCYPYQSVEYAIP